MIFDFSFILVAATLLTGLIFTGGIVVLLIGVAVAGPVWSD